MSKLPVTPLSQLANFVDKQQVICIEGKIVAVYPKKEGEGQYGKWVMQDVNLSGDGVEHKITIGDEKKLLSESDKGKTVRISAGTDKKGALSGLQYEVKKSGDKTYRKVKVGSWAKIEFLGAGGEPVASGQGAASSGRSTASQGGNTGHSSGGRNGAQVGNAINNATLLLAHGFSPLPDGVDPLAHLEQTAKQILAIADRLEKTPASLSTETKPMGWRSAVSPKSGQALGEMSEDNLKKVIKWAFQTTSPQEDLKAFHGQVLLAAPELSITHYSLLVEAGADPEGLEKLFKRDAGKGVDQFDTEDWANAYKNFEAIVKQSQEMANELGDDDIPF